MKVFFFLLVPLFSVAQTVHIKNEEIEYEGKVKTEGLSAKEIHLRAQDVLNAANDNRLHFVVTAKENSVQSKGEMKLKTPYNLIRTVFYTLEITPFNNGYTYHIDSVYLKEQERGKKAKVKSSKELLEGMGEAGKPLIETEKIVNEIDMRFQQLLAGIKSAIASIK